MLDVYLEEIIIGILITVLLGMGSSIIAYVKKRDKCISSTLGKVDKIDKKLNQLIKVILIDYKKNHKDTLDEFEELLKLIDDDE